MNDLVPVEEYKLLIKKRTSAPAVSGSGKKTTKGSKYNNVKVHTDEGTFDSKWEHERWRSLKLLEAKGAITELKRQVIFRLTFGKIVVESYRADFTYMERGKYVVEDAKGAITPAYRRKRKWMRGFHGIVIKETFK
jgi:hypothetical protein